MFYIYENDLNPMFVNFSGGLHVSVVTTSHINYYSELVVCLKGRLEVTVNYKKRILHEGEGTFVQSLEVHEFLEGENEALIFCFSPVLFSDLLKNLPISEAAVGKISKEGLSYIKQLAGVRLSYPQDENRIRLLLGCLLYEIPCVSTKPEREESLAICRAVAYLEENYAEKITLEDLARGIGVNRTYASRMFSRYLSGATFIRILNEIRLYHAMELMESKTIAQAALEAGFGSVRQFNRVFKAAFCKTPGEFLGHVPTEKRKITVK